MSDDRVRRPSDIRRRSHSPSAVDFAGTSIENARVLLATARFFTHHRQPAIAESVLRCVELALSTADQCRPSARGEATRHLQLIAGIYRDINQLRNCNRTAA